MILTIPHPRTATHLNSIDDTTLQLDTKNSSHLQKQLYNTTIPYIHRKTHFDQTPQTSRLTSQSSQSLAPPMSHSHDTYHSTSRGAVPELEKKSFKALKISTCHLNCGSLMSDNRFHLIIAWHNQMSWKNGEDGLRSWVYESGHLRRCSMADTQTQSMSSGIHPSILS